MILQKDDRFDSITSILESTGKVSVAKLAIQLSVTPETIRRDLSELENEGRLTRIHGGAVPFIQNKKEMEFQRKLDINREAKMEIARHAAEQIEDGDYIAIDVGSTTVHIADSIQNLHNITVVTNSLAATERFNLALEEKRMTGKVIMLGGVSNPEQSSVAGVLTLNMLRQIKIDKVFLSCGGLTDATVYDYDLDESLVSSEMVKQSAEIILLADASKIGATSYFTICPFENINEVISDRSCPNEWQDLLEQKEIVWTTVKPGGE